MRVACGLAACLVCGVTLAATVTEPATFTSLHVFTAADGGRPSGALVTAPDGTIYGMTDSGLYKISPSGGFAVLHRFTPREGGGGSPGVTLGADTNLYSPMYFKAPESGGAVIVKITSAGAVSVIHEFAPDDPAVRTIVALGRLAQAPDGSFYAPARTPVSRNDAGMLGAIYRVKPDGTFTLIPTQPRDLACCGWTGLVALDSTSFLGVLKAEQNLPPERGGIFRITTNGEFAVVHALTPADGTNPTAALIRARDGNFYGTTTGTDPPAGDYGNIFRVTPSGEFTVVHRFNGADGRWPSVPLVEAEDGTFYGTTDRGGLEGYGTIFRLAPGGQMSVLYSFKQPGAPVYVTLGRDGALYGADSTAGPEHLGEVFKLIPVATSHFVLTTGSGSHATVKSGVLTFKETTSGQTVTIRVARPSFVQAQMLQALPGSTGPWVWVSDDGHDGAMINLGTDGSVDVHAMPGPAARQLLANPN